MVGLAGCCFAPLSPAHSVIAPSSHARALQFSTLSNKWAQEAKDQLKKKWTVTSWISFLIQLH